MICSAALAGCATQPPGIGELVKTPLGIEQTAGGKYVVCHADFCPARTAKTQWGEGPDGSNMQEPLLTLRFPFDVWHLQPEHRKQLGAFVNDVWPTLQGNALLVVGYTDDIGPARYNWILARKRADSVARALRDLGVHPVRIKGKGRCCYVEDNETPQGRAANRRAEIHLIVNDNAKEPSQ